MEIPFHIFVTDTRTHPPLQYTFPPMPVKSSDTSSVQRDANSDDSDLEEEGSPNRSQSYRTRNSSEPDPHSIHKLTSQSILLHTSPYVILDEARSPAYSPSTKAVLPMKKNNDGKQEYNRITQSRLPNQTLHIDLRTLNLHLAIRAKEILACSESMWEWVLEYQAKVQAQEKLGRPRPISLEASHPCISQTSIVSRNSSISTESTKSALLEITRDDFDYILSNFELYVFCDLYFCLSHSTFIAEICKIRFRLAMPSKNASLGLFFRHHHLSIARLLMLLVKSMNSGWRSSDNTRLPTRSDTFMITTQVTLSLILTKFQTLPIQSVLGRVRR